MSPSRTVTHRHPLPVATALATRYGLHVENALPIKWIKGAADAMSARVGPFVIKVVPKGDGRWAWQVFSGQAENPTATGLASSLGAAKRTTEQFVKRSGLV